MGLDNVIAKVKYTPDGSVPLVKNEDGVPVRGSFNYNSNVGIMLYLSGHTRPEIAFSVNYCERYFFVPRIHMKRLWIELVGI